MRVIKVRWEKVWQKNTQVMPDVRVTVAGLFPAPETYKGKPLHCLILCNNGKGTVFNKVLLARKFYNRGQTRNVHRVSDCQSPNVLAGNPTLCEKYPSQKQKL